MLQLSYPQEARRRPIAPVGAGFLQFACGSLPVFWMQFSREEENPGDFVYRIGCRIARPGEGAKTSFTGDFYISGVISELDPVGRVREPRGLMRRSPLHPPVQSDRAEERALWREVGREIVRSEEEAGRRLALDRVVGLLLAASALALAGEPCALPENPGEIAARLGLGTSTIARALRLLAVEQDIILKGRRGPEHWAELPDAALEDRSGDA